MRGFDKFTSILYWITLFGILWWHILYTLFSLTDERRFYISYTVVLRNRVLIPLGKGSVAFSLTGFISRGSNFWYFSFFFLSLSRCNCRDREGNKYEFNQLWRKIYDERGNVIKYKGRKRRLGDGVLFADRYLFLLPANRVFTTRSKQN